MSYLHSLATTVGWLSCLLFLCGVGMVGCPTVGDEEECARVGTEIIKALFFPAVFGVSWLVHAGGGF